MNIGFTGTRDGMAPKQMEAFRELIQHRGTPDEFHHGACVGADEESVQILMSVGGEITDIHAHPSTLKGMTSKSALARSNTVHDPLPPLERNCNIVDACDLLIACPKTEQEEQRSGTWATIRYARSKGVAVIIVTPDGYFIAEDE